MAFEIKAARFNISALSCLHKCRNISSIRSKSYDHRPVCTHSLGRSNLLNGFLGIQMCKSYNFTSVSSWINNASPKNRFRTVADKQLTIHPTIQVPCTSSNMENERTSRIQMDAATLKPLDIVLTMLCVNNFNIHQNRLPSFDLQHYIRVVNQLLDNIIILSNQYFPANENHHVTAECKPFSPSSNTQHRSEFVDLITLDKNMMVNASDVKSTSSSNQSSVGEGSGGKPSQKQLEYVFERLSNFLPNLFIRTHDYGLYHSELIFQNNLRGVTTKGLSSYVSQIALLRLAGHVRFGYVNLQVLKITKHPEDGTVRVRWRICGIPGYKMIFTFWRYRIFNLKDTISSQQKLWYEGFSTFYVGSDGLIQKHLCEKLMPDDSEEEVKKGNDAVNSP